MSHFWVGFLGFCSFSMLGWGFCFSWEALEQRRASQGGRLWEFQVPLDPSADWEMELFLNGNPVLQSPTPGFLKNPVSGALQGQDLAVGPCSSSLSLCPSAVVLMGPILHVCHVCHFLPLNPSSLIMTR
jgi:hypothetical protein